VKSAKLGPFSIGDSSTLPKQYESDEGSEFWGKAKFFRIVQPEGVRLNLLEYFALKFVLMLLSLLLASLLHKQVSSHI
jgi:hypothetical protein